MKPCDIEGTFQGTITDYALNEYGSGAVAVYLKCVLRTLWDESDEVWKPCQEMEAEGNVFIVKKDGSRNDNGVKSLVAFAGWNRDLRSITDRTWRPTAVAVVVQKEVYNSQTRFKIAFVNNYHSAPKGQHSVNASRAMELQAKFGGQFAALHIDEPVAPASSLPPPPAGRSDSEIPF